MRDDQIERGWNQFNLEEIANVASGVTLGSEPDGSTSIELPYLRVANVQDGFIDVGDMKVIRILRSHKRRLLLEAGDVLLTEGGDFDKLGRGAVWDGRIPECTYQNHIFRVRVDRSRILPRYLAAYISSLDGKRYFLSVAKRTTNLASINSKQLKAMPILFPPVQEQRRVVEILDALDARMAAEERIIIKTLDIKEGTLAKLSGDSFSCDEVVRLGDISSMITSGSRGWAEYYSNEGALFVRIGNLTREHINLRFDDCVRVRVPRTSEGRRTSLLPGDVLISITADLGIIGVVPGGLGEAYVNQHVALVRVASANPRWIGHFLASLHGRHQFQLANDSGAKAGLNLPTISSIRVPTPNLARQAQMADILDGLDLAINKYRTKLAKLKLIKQGLMDDLLTGRVRMKDIEKVL